MSSQYTLEPQPTAKVLLQTTSGDILVELFAKQTPLTSRNFLQLCLDGYYDNTIFHRLVPGFIVQGGDPTGTGAGGESSYDGEPFADEFHSRLKYNRRGLLGMANTGKDDNGSQFFFTLGNTPELTGKNTMFGRVVGDTIYNLIKMGEAELIEGTEKPTYPTKLTGVEILVNPFEDMIKRPRVAQRTREEKKEKKKPKRKAGKAVLSFGGDEDGEDITPVLKKPKFNPKLVNAGEETANKLTTPIPEASSTLETRSVKDVSIAKKSSPKGSAKASDMELKPPRRSSPSPRPELETKLLPSRSKREPSQSESSLEPEESSKTLLDRTNAQIAELKASMRRNVQNSAPAPKKKSALESMIPATATKGRKRRPGGANGSSAEEKDALDFLSAFKKKLEATPASASAQVPVVGIHSSATLDKAPSNGKAVDEGGLDDEAELCDLHFIANCQSCTAWDKDGHPEEDDNDNDVGWMSQAISFEKDRLGKDLEWKRKNEEELMVIDPREKAQDIKLEQRKRRDEQGAREERHKDRDGKRREEKGRRR